MTPFELAPPARAVIGDNGLKSPLCYTREQDSQGGNQSDGNKPPGAQDDS
jgi:hypothetical protein